jgi:hypothetical protein
LISTPPNKRMKLTSAEHIGRSQLILSVRRTWGEVSVRRVRLCAIGTLVVLAGACDAKSAQDGASGPPPRHPRRCDASVEASRAKPETGRHEVRLVVGSASASIGDPVSIRVGFPRSSKVLGIATPVGWVASERECGHRGLCWQEWSTSGGLRSGIRVEGFTISFGGTPSWQLREWAAVLPKCVFGGRLQNVEQPGSTAR